MKTFNMEDIISWYNHDEAEKYIGKEGYFADKEWQPFEVEE